MTPEQIAALDDQLQHSEIVKDLQNKDAEILEDLEDLKTGQDEINQRLESGDKKMDSHDQKIDTLGQEVAEVKKDIADLKHVMTTQHQEVINTVKDKENERLKGDLKSMMDEKRTTDNRIWDILKIFTALLIAAALGYLGIK